MTTFENARPVLEQWNRSHPPIYQVRDCDLRWNLTEQNLVNYETMDFAGVPSLIASATADGVRAGLSATTLWVPLWGHIPEGREADFARALTERCGPKARLFLGADEFHFIPGIPLDEAGHRLMAAVRSAGFEGADACDFTGALAQDEVRHAIDEAETLRAQHGWRFDDAESAAELDALADFLSREFPGRWTREFNFWRSRNDTGRAFWKLLRGEGPEILGFARMAVRGRILPIDTGWTPGALRLPLSAQRLPALDDGCLGPIGVAVSQRGKGAGRVLLGLVLQALRQHRAEQICIDWTNAIKYYEPLHFERARQYWTAWMIGSS